MSKIKIEADKKKHFWVGMLMGAILQVFFLYFFSNNYWLSILMTFILILVLCYGFELFSLVTKLGHYDLLDAVAGTVGGAIGMGIIIIIEYFFVNS